jgi:chemotaxis-related protein WspB
MLLIACQAGADRYAVESHHVTEVVPRAHLQHPKGLSPRLAGVMVYRGSTMPVIDLTQITHGVPCPNRLSSRIIVLHAEVEEADSRLGLLAENVRLREMDAALKENVRRCGERTALGRLCFDEQGVFQLLNARQLFGEITTETLASEERQ